LTVARRFVFDLDAVLDFVLDFDTVLDFVLNLAAAVSRFSGCCRAISLPVGLAISLTILLTVRLAVFLLDVSRRIVGAVLRKRDGGTGKRNDGKRRRGQKCRA
jgi:hypothetical protein